MLSTEQQKIIVDSMWVVNSALKAQGLSYDEDLRQNAVLHLCDLLNRFDESKGVKWTTYAYKSVYYYIKKEHNKESYRQMMTLPLEVAENVASEPLYTEIDEIYDMLKAKYGIECANVLELKINKTSIKAISEILGIPKSKVNDHIEKIKYEILQINSKKL